MNILYKYALSAFIACMYAWIEVRYSDWKRWRDCAECFSEGGNRSMKLSFEVNSESTLFFFLISLIVFRDCLETPEQNVIEMKLCILGWQKHLKRSSQKFPTQLKRWFCSCSASWEFLPLGWCWGSCRWTELGCFCSEQPSERVCGCNFAGTVQAGTGPGHPGGSVRCLGHKHTGRGWLEQGFRFPGERGISLASDGV